MTEFEERKPGPVAQRHRRVGGTEIGILCGVKSFGTTAFDVWNRIVNGVSKFEGNVYSDRGQKYEPVVRGLYVKETGASLSPHPGVLLFEDWAAASMDDVACRRREQFPVDYKTASVKGMSKWKRAGQWVLPPNYEYQLRHYVAVMNMLGRPCDRAELFVAFGVDVKVGDEFTGEFDIKETRLLSLDRDTDLEHHMLEVGRQWWRDYVVPKIPPPCDRDRDLVKVSDMNLSKEEMEFLGLSAPVPGTTAAPVASTSTAVAPQPAPARRLVIEDQSTSPDTVPCTPAIIQGSPYKLPSGNVGTFICTTGGRYSFKVEGGVELLDAGTPVLPLAAILPPDAPASNPELASECVNCPSKQHLLAECPVVLKAAEPPPAEKPARKRRTAKQIANDAAAASAGHRAGFTWEDLAAMAAASAGVAVQGATVDSRSEALKEISAIGQEQRVEAVAAFLEQSTIPPAEAAKLILGPPPSQAAVDSGLRLYINALPGPGVEAKSLAPYVDLITRKLAELTGDQDIRSSDSKQFGYGKWKGELAAFVRQTPPQSGAYFAMTAESEFMQVVVEALSSKCAPGFPVRGVR